MNAAARAGPSALSLCRLLIALRLRLLRNRLRRGPQVGTARFAALLGLLVPLAYLGLFLSALETIGIHGGVAAESGALVLVATAIALASGLLKMAGAEAVTGAGGESEFLLTRPLSLGTLVVARGLAGAATDLYDALFLLPVLAAAALAWNLGAGALAVAAATSVFVQVAVSAFAQAAQIAMVHLIRPARRRLATTVCALLSALAMALLWMAGSTVLRVPEAAARALTTHREWLSWLPGSLIAAPLAALRAGDPLGSLGALMVLAAIGAGALALAWWVARASTRRGWEQAETPWVASGTGAGPGKGAPLGLSGKDWRLLVRDRARLITFLGLPALFVGIQVFGSAGWDWLAADATRLALVSYSLAAYAATFGPLQHMAAERRAFWLLRMAPIPIGRLLAAKATFWACVVAGLAALAYGLLALLSRAVLGWEALLTGALAILGAAGVAFLAVGLAAAVADLSDDTRPAVGVGTTYLFMLVAGLYNLVILSPGPDRWRALLLYAVAAAAAWTTGVQRAADLFDPEETRRKLLSPPVGALALVLLFLGERAGRAAAAALDAGSVPLAELPWITLVGIGVAIHRLRHRPVALPGGWRRGLLIATTLGIAGALLAHDGTVPATGPGIATVLLLVRPVVEEVAARGVLQAGLHRPGDAAPRRAAILLASAVAAWAVSSAPFAPAGIAAALLPAITLAASNRLGDALLTRGLIETFPKLVAI